jgi:uncharacterized glyoxalase superfamily protein PhnB
METTTILYRPVGPKELQLIVDSESGAFPPRFPERPIFHPVLNEELAILIARENSPGVLDSGRLLSHRDGGGAMPQTVVPIIHVSDVRATVEWYKSIGFALIRTNEEDGELNWAKLRFGNSELMFNLGGKASAEQRREVDLYITAENIDGIFQRLKHQAEIVEEPHDTFYGMREFILRDCNRFWIAFGQPVK